MHDWLASKQVQHESGVAQRTSSGIRHQGLAAQKVQQLLLDDGGGGCALAAGIAQPHRQAAAHQDGQVRLEQVLVFSGWVQGMLHLSTQSVVADAGLHGVGGCTEDLTSTAVGCSAW